MVSEGLGCVTRGPRGFQGHFKKIQKIFIGNFQRFRIVSGTLTLVVVHLGHYDPNKHAEHVVRQRDQGC